MKELMFDSTVIATLKVINGKKLCILDKTIPCQYIPPDLFFDNKSEVSFEELCDWADRRILPTERMGYSRAMSQAGITHESRTKAVFATRASTLTDPYWIKYLDTDTYEGVTLRGQSGIKPIMIT